MSLFKARDWWSTTVGEDEEFDQGCLCVANFDNADDELGNITYARYILIQQDKIKVKWFPALIQSSGPRPVNFSFFI